MLRRLLQLKARQAKVGNRFGLIYGYNGIGEVSVDGSYSVTPLATTNYLLTAYGVDNSQNTCSVTLTVQEPPVVTVPKCEAFTATPGSLPVGGGNVKLAWTTSNASIVSIMQVNLLP